MTWGRGGAYNFPMMKWSQLLRGFFPSWKFFDVVGTEFRLEARFGKSEASLGPWMNCLQPISRSVRNLFLNAQGNYLHVCHTLLRLLHADIQACENTDELFQRASYRIIRNLVQDRLGPISRSPNVDDSKPYVFQFRLLIGSPGREEPALLSAVHEAL